MTTTSSTNSGASATPCATTASTTATTSSSSRTCCSSRWPTSADVDLPEHTDWPYLRKQSGTDLLDAYIEALRLLGKEPRHPRRHLLRLRRPASRNPVNLQKLIGLIDETEWTSIDIDVKAAAFEGLLEKAASEGKKGAGQYFTPRLLIQSIVRCIKPDPRVSQDFTIDDPACGHGRLPRRRLRVAQGSDQGGALDRDTAKRIRTSTYFGRNLSRGHADWR